MPASFYDGPKAKPMMDFGGASARSPADVYRLLYLGVGSGCRSAPGSHCKSLIYQDTEAARGVTNSHRLTHPSGRLRYNIKSYRL